MIDQAFHASEAFGERKKMGVLEEAPGPGEISLQYDGDHSAERAHLFLRELVLRMLLQARIVNPLDLRFLLEPASDLEGILAVPFHPESERLQSPKREKTVERSGNRADGVLQKRDLIAELLVFA